MRRSAIVLAIVLFVGGVWFTIPSADRGTPPSEPVEDASDPEPQVTSLPGPGDLESSPAEVDRNLERSELTDEPAEPDDREIFTVRVVNRQTREPLPGAEVYYITEGEIEAMMRAVAEDPNLNEMEPDVQMKRFGKRLTADSLGRVLVPVGEFTSLSGQRGDLRGQLAIVRDRPLPESEEVYQLELERDLTLTIRVVDSGGEPAADVPLALLAQYEGDQQAWESVGWSRTATDGMATIPRVQTLTRRFDAPQAPKPIGFVVRPFIPGLTEGGVPVDLESPPQDPVELQLPMTGRVVVLTTDGNRGPLISPSGATLRLAPDETSTDPAGNRRLPSWAGRPMEGARVVFDWVVLGRTYLAGSRLGMESVSAVFPGPRGQGQEVHVTLSLDSDAFILSGRAVDAEREPLANAELRIEYRYGPGNGREEFRTDGDGSFRFPIMNRDVPDILSLITVQTTGRAARPNRQTSLNFRSDREIRLVEGDNSLGEIVLEPSSVIGSGRIFVDGEPPTIWSEIRFQVEYLGDGSPEGENRQGLTPDLRFRRQGSEFEVLGIARPGRYRIHNDWHVDHLPIDPLEFELGAENLEINLRSGGWIMATAWLDEGVTAEDLRVRLVPLDNQIQESLSEASRERLDRMRRLDELLSAWFSGQEEGRARYRSQRLWPGRYRLEMSLPGVAEPLAEVSDVLIVAGEQTADPRLDGIDLRGKSRGIRVEILGIEGPRLDGHGTTVAINDRTERATLTGFKAREGVATVLTTQSSVDLLILERGYLPVELNGVSSDITVTLERVPEIVARVPGARDLPAGISLSVSLRKRQARDNRRVDGGQRLSYWLQPADTQWIRSGEGDGEEVRLRAGADGPHSLSVRVMDNETRGGANVEGVEPAVIDVRRGEVGRVVEVRLPEAGLRVAIERAKRGR